MTWLHIYFKFMIIITENYFGFMESLGFIMMLNVMF